MSLTDTTASAGTTVVYLCGYREVHRPQDAVGVAKPLEAVARLAQERALPLAEPSPGARPGFEQGAVRLLRLDRASEHLAGRGATSPLQFLFVLTRQHDERFSRNDTIHLRPLLERWCRERGHGYEDTVVRQPPNQLDTAGEELIGELDEHLASASEVVLFIGGGPAALQVASHFASFRGVRSREKLTILQLEEVVDQCPGCGSSDVVDTKVREVRRFHGIVGRRSIQHQASRMLEGLDLPSAAQLVLAAGDAGIAPQASHEAERLAAALARDLGDAGPVERLAAAVDLAEVEWSRPGGSAMEALWYASIAVTELVPDAFGAANPCTAPEVSQELAEKFKDAVAPRRQDGDLKHLRMGPTQLRRSWPLLRAGPARIMTAGGEVDLHRTLGIVDPPAQPDGSVLLWYALLVALKPVRNKHAHELVTQRRDEAERRLRALSRAFVDAADVLSSGKVTDRQRDPNGFAGNIERMSERLDAIDGALEDQEPQALVAKAVEAKRRENQNCLEQLADGEAGTLARMLDNQINRLVGLETFDSRWFAVASARMPTSRDSAVEEQRERLRGLVAEEVTRLRTEEVIVPCALEMAVVEQPLDLLVEFDVAGSNFRGLLRTVIPALSDRNTVVEIASEFHAALDT